MQELETLRVELAGTRRALEAASRQQQQALAAAKQGSSQQLQRVQDQVILATSTRDVTKAVRRPSMPGQPAQSALDVASSNRET